MTRVFGYCFIFIPNEVQLPDTSEMADGQLSEESVSAVVAGIEGSSEEDAQQWLQAGAVLGMGQVIGLLFWSLHQ